MLAFVTLEITFSLEFPICCLIRPIAIEKSTRSSYNDQQPPLWWLNNIRISGGPHHIIIQFSIFLVHAVHVLCLGHSACHNETSERDVTCEAATPSAKYIENAVVSKILQELKPEKNELENIFRENISFQQYERQRFQHYFMSRDQSAKQDTRQHSSTAPLHNYDFDKEGFLNYIRELEPGCDINWSAWARDIFPVYINGTVPTNAGHVLKLYAESCGIQTSQFNLGRTISGRQIPKRIRRIKRKILNGQYSVPSTRPTKVVKQELQQKIKDGTIVVGNQVVATSVTSKSGITRNVYGRHIPLRDILQEELNRLENAGLILLQATSAESNEATMFFKMWHDHATIAGKSHLAVMVQILHDADTHIMDPASQTVIEKPRLWILAQSGSSIKDQSLYSQHRSDDLKSLTEPITSSLGLSVTFIPRFVCVDYPARAFETGQQIGGNYSCPCGISKADHINLTAAFTQSPMSLSDREAKVKDGVLWQSRTIDGLLKETKKDELLRETQARHLYAGTTYQRPTKAGLMEQLTFDLHGIHRLPALLLGNPSENILTICPKLEVPMCEVLHDFLGVMENILEELPLHVPALEDIFLTLKGGRDRLRAIDARFLAVSFAQYAVTEKLPDPVRQLAQMMVEISEISYGFSLSRSPRTILRLYNVTFSLGLILLDLVGPSPKKVSAGRFFGIHFHGLTAHLADLYRIISIRSLVPEQEEANFHKLKQIVQRTSSRHPQHVLDNCMIRQAYTVSEERRNYEHSLLSRQASKLTRMGNTVLSRNKCKAELKAHLQERVADYVAAGWCQLLPSGDLMFLDGYDEPHSRPDVSNTLKLKGNYAVDAITPECQIEGQACLFIFHFLLTWPKLIWPYPFIFSGVIWQPVLSLNLTGQLKP